MQANTGEPIVSIITPTYNHAKYIARCIDSVLEQSFTSWEMIIVNDGSTDNTLAIAGSYAEKDPRIKVINQLNKGIFRLNETYNTALDLSRGKYIAILEGDDIWEKNKLEWQVQALNNNPDVAVCWGKAYLVKANTLQRYSLSPGEGANQEFFNNNPAGSLANILFFENIIPALTLLIRKSCLVEAGIFSQTHGLPLVDLPTLFKLLPKGKFFYIDKALGSWRIYADQVTKTYPVEIVKGRYALSLEYFEKMKKDGFANIRVSKEEIDRYFKKRILIAYSRSGRYKLIRKDFNGARKDYLEAIRYKGGNELVWKLRAITGLIFSFFHLDVEWLAALLGRNTYK